MPVGPVLSLEDLPHHEQVVHNGIVIDWEHPTAGPLRQAGPAAHFSATPVVPAAPGAAPRRGHRRRAAGRPASPTTRSLTLRAAGVVGVRPS